MFKVKSASGAHPQSVGSYQIMSLLATLHRLNPAGATP